MPQHEFYIILNKKGHKTKTAEHFYISDI